MGQLPVHLCGDRADYFVSSGRLAFGGGDAEAGGGDGGVEEPELDDAGIEVLSGEGFGASDGGGFGVVAEGVFEDGVEF